MPRPPVQGQDQRRRARLGARLGAVHAAARAGGLAQRPHRPLRRHRHGGLGAVRRAHPHADARAPRRRRPALQPVAHHGAVLADALVHAHRPQPPPERDGVHRRGRDRLPGLQRAPAQGVRDRRPRPARQRLEHLLGRQGPLRARRRRPTRAVPSSTGRCSRASIASTASSAARPTSGIRRWSRTTTRSTSPTRPTRATTCPRTSPTRRCR